MESFALTHFEGLWEIVQNVPWLRGRINRLLINTAIHKTATRPYPITTCAPYTSWESLTDRTYSSRHLPPPPPPADLPDVEALADLFVRRGLLYGCHLTAE